MRLPVPHVGFSGAEQAVVIDLLTIERRPAGAVVVDRDDDRYRRSDASRDGADRSQCYERDTQPVSHATLTAPPTSSGSRST